MKGIIYKSTGSWYLVRGEDGRFYQARIKGKMKIDREISSTNPVAVGDLVVLEREEGDDAMITAIEKRGNYIVRVSPHNKHQKHIVAANLDLALLVATVQEPQTSFGFIDRFLVTAEAYHIPAVLVINKADLLQDEEGQAVLRHWQQIYTHAGYPVLTLSAQLPESLTPLKEMLRDKTTLFSGHSGVGKSTLINHLIPELDLRTEIVSEYSGKGQHTTTFAEMFDLPGGGRIIDTPGVKEFGLIDMQQDELAEYYPEMRRLLPDCRFANCKHINEPGCAVKAGLPTGLVAAERYQTYLSIWESVEKIW
ncbi:MAG: ribosome small subunit-dependent GTPase A [Chitinophagaceae bacterium]|nr:ribosome small subunit-dependent GTPase A [Chitinophagaceae bacterium]